jgi:hypothetical protein
LKSATYDADAEFVYARVMRGIGSVSKDWRRVATEMMMTDELAWLRVQDASAMAACVSAFPHARSLRVTGRIKRNGRQEDFVPLLGSKSIVRLELMDNAEMESSVRLGKLARLRALRLGCCRRLTNLQPLSGLVGLQTLVLSMCRS